MLEEKRHKWAVSPFTAILLMVALSVAGIASAPLLNIQYTPTAPGREVEVSFRYPDASAQVVEGEITSPLEGVLSALGGITEVSSVSQKGSGSVRVRFAKGKDMDAARFEVASAIRNVYPSLPGGVSYPDIRVTRQGTSRTRSELVYVLKGEMPSLEIEKYAREHLLGPLSSLPEVDGVVLSGATPFQWVITFDARKAGSLGLSASEIAAAFQSNFADEVLGMVHTDEGVFSVRLSGAESEDFGSIPVGKVGERIVYLRDLATWRYEEQLPSSYYRVNGLNTVVMAVSTVHTSNLLRAVASARGMMERLEASFPDGISASVAYDASRFVEEELGKIYRRTALCILILLAFVLVVSRSGRYLFVMVSTLAVNILSALAFYALLGIQIHLYTLAGITVSLSIIIDTSIVMADHFSRWKDRKVFPAIFAATVTTVGALLAVLLLPESERGNLTDFIWVIVVNLTLSLAVAYFFVPSLITLVSLKRKESAGSPRRLRRLAVLEHAFEGYIGWGVRHRLLLGLLCVMAFGIPVFLLPSAGDWGKAGEILSSSFGLFYRTMDRANFYREPSRKQLIISAGMLEGSSVNQLNEVVRYMENYLAGFPQIEVFTTNISSYDNATLVVEFKPEYENSSFPVELKSMVTAMAIDFGGANWRVYGIDDRSFNNNVVADYKDSHILLEGYNYQQLSAFAARLIDHLSLNPRVSEPEIWSSEWSGRPVMEWNLDYDFEAMTAAGVNPYHYYDALSSLLYDKPVGPVLLGGEMEQVVLRSSDAEKYDLWHVMNAPIAVDSLKMTLSTVGNIVKKRSGNVIRKTNQSYQLDVCFDFIGSYTLERHCIEEALRYMNDTVLPLGYKARDGQPSWDGEQKKRYAWLILLIVGILFILLSISLESVRLPLAVIGMIPVSFIGVFLSFGLSDFSFDQGGYASFVMLSGIVVNAGIYVTTAYKQLGGMQKPSPMARVSTYVRAFRYKAVPISLTVLSTVLGLLPFLSDGPKEVFWFDFAVGTISGLAFSILALVLLLPVFVVKRA